MQNKRLLGIMAIAAFILIIPFIAMQFTNEVKWTIMDFVVAGGLLSGTGLLFEFVLRKVKKAKTRLTIGGLILALLFLIWIELAVGLFGTPLAGS